jgi:hypothetical protein
LQSPEEGGRLHFLVQPAAFVREVLRETATRSPR